MPQASPTAATAVRFAGVVKHFGRIAALDDVTLDIAGGSFVALVGQSGSGKTTLLKCVNRLLLPDAGTVEVDTLRTADTVQLRRGIGYAFQGIGLLPHLSVSANIAVPLRLQRWPASRIAARLAVLLDLVELPQSLAVRMPAELSGGQRQRVGFARAIAAEPSLVLLDEPFGALDPTTRDALGTRYRSLHTTLGLTSIMVTHDVQEALLLADRIVVLRDGRIVADDTPRRLVRGHADAGVAAMFAVPRLQAARIAALEDATEGDAGGAGRG